MSRNPWFLEQMAEYENDRIQRAIKQIHLQQEERQAGGTEQKIMKARVQHSRPLGPGSPVFVQWLFAWMNTLTHSFMNRREHHVRDEQQIMVANVSDCTSCGD